MAYARPVDWQLAKGHPRPTETKLDQGHNHDDDEERNSDRGSVTHLEELEGILVDIHDQAAAGVARASLGQNNDRVEHLQRPNHVDNQIEKEGWANQWQGNVAKEMPAVRAIELGGRIVIDRNVLQPSKEYKHRKTRVAPDVHDDDRWQHPLPVAQPGNGRNVQQTQVVIDDSRVFLIQE